MIFQRGRKHLIEYFNISKTFNGKLFNNKFRSNFIISRGYTDSPSNNSSTNANERSIEANEHSFDLSFHVSKIK